LNKIEEAAKNITRESIRIYKEGKKTEGHRNKQQFNSAVDEQDSIMSEPNSANPKSKQKGRTEDTMQPQLHMKRLYVKQELT